MKIASFLVDVTPPVGNSIAFGINEKTDSSIFIRGAIIDDAKTRIVLASCDFLYIWGKAYGQMQKVIANAAGTMAKNVFLHSVHQHDSVRIALELNEVFRKYKGIKCTPLPYYKMINRKLKESIETAIKKMRKVKYIATAERRISGLASNRRLLDKSSKVYAMRWSMCYDLKLQKEPTGVVDPALRSIGFVGNNNKPLAIMHFYASHPMAAYMRNMCSSDVPGVALDYAQKHCKNNALQIYFTGCGGNVTFGKYSLENKAASLKLLGERLGKELVENCNHLELRKPEKISIKRSSFALPLKPELNEKDLLDKLEKSKEKNEMTLLATRLEMLRNWPKWRKINIFRISIGCDVSILSFPSETVVEYQLYAQSLIPEKFLSCAAYANSSYGYIPTALMYEEGGYEPGYGAVTTAKVEEKMKNAIYECLKDLI
jgi:hypothetical protein